MAIAFPSGSEPPQATNDTATTQTAHTVLLTDPTAMTVATAADCLDCRRQPRPGLPSFTMNAIPDNCPGATANPLLVVNTGNDGNMNSFITLTLVTNRQNRQDNRNTVAFDNNVPEAIKRINIRLAEIANQGPPLKTTVTNCLDHQFQTDANLQTNIRVHTQIKIDPTLTTTIETTTVHGKATPTEPAIVVAQKNTLPNIAPKHHFGASGATLPHMTKQFAGPNLDQVHLWNHQVQVVTTPSIPPTNTIL